MGRGELAADVRAFCTKGGDENKVVNEIKNWEQVHFAFQFREEPQNTWSSWDSGSLNGNKNEFSQWDNKELLVEEWPKASAVVRWDFRGVTSFGPINPKPPWR